MAPPITAPVPPPIIQCKGRKLLLIDMINLYLIFQKLE